VTLEQQFAINTLRQDAEAAANDPGGPVLAVGTDLATITPQNNQVIRLGDGEYPLSKTLHWYGTKNTRLIGTPNTVIKATGNSYDHDAMILMHTGADHGTMVNACLANLKLYGNHAAKVGIKGYVAGVDEPRFDGLFGVGLTFRGIACALSLSGPGPGVPAAQRLCLIN
jgi:hypothetical protein